MDTDNKILPGELRVLMNHIYEYDKGVRSMILCTLNKKFEHFATARLASRGIPYVVQRVGTRCVNLYFGRSECLDIVRMIVDRSLTKLTPEEDFILGVLLGYDICEQCKRFCIRKQKSTYNINN